MRIREHALHLYRDDAELATTVAEFLAPAFAEAQAILTIGTRAHVASIEQRLRTEGHDVDRARWRGQYQSLDAAHVIPRLLRDGLPTAETFGEVVGGHVTRLAADHGGVRAFGEIVALLWRDGKHAAALRLEDLWNDSLGRHPLALVCGYPERDLGDEHRRRIGDRHTSEIQHDAPETARRRAMPEAAS
ncbi:MAG TPA: MEDS domain-containing protein [Candidatus Limnocylindria bacterium]|nr:MEDS domain-containing protein [Candidatus Limnocylindria bacterium]